MGEQIPALKCDVWQDVLSELDCWSAQNRTARLWLRDDDAVSSTPALEQLLALSTLHHAPILLGVVPMLARRCLGERLARCPAVTVAMHGIWHRDHAAAGQKKEELPLQRGRQTIIDALTQGRTRLLRIFGEPAGFWYIPPWNRISRDVAGLLPGIGFAGLSCFAQTDHGIAGLAQRNTHLDLIDWKAARAGKPPHAMATELAAELARARAEGFRPVGVLAHHLAQDDIAWRSLSEMLQVTSGHRAVKWIGADELRD